MKNITICILRICALNTIGYVGNRAGQRSLGKFRKVREDNIKIYVKDNSVRRYKQDLTESPEGPMAESKSVQLIQASIKSCTHIPNMINITLSGRI